MMIGFAISGNEEEREKMFRKLRHGARQFDAWLKREVKAEHQVKLRKRRQIHARQRRKQRGLA